VASVSIVVEWDNFKPSRAHRPRAMLQQLDRQAAALPGDVEVIVTFDSDEVAKDDVESFLDAAVCATGRGSTYGSRTRGNPLSPAEERGR